MLTLAVAHREESFERIQGPLADRDIRVEHVSITGQRTPISARTGNLPEVDVGLVFPGRIIEGGVLDALIDVPWVNDREAVLRSRNKAETLARLDAALLPIPETIMVSNPVDDPGLDQAVEHLDAPIVVKPNSTTRGRGVLKLEDVDSLRGATEYLELVHEFPGTRDRSYLLQEYLPDARDFRVMVIDGEYAGAVERRLPDAAREKGRWQHNVHRGASATPVLPARPVRELAEEAAAVVDVPFVGVDILSNGEQTVVAETNARPTVDSEGKYVEDFYDRLAGLIRDTADT